MSQWSPNLDALNQLVLILSGTLSSNKSVRVQATEALKKASAEPDFDNYLLHILVEGQQQPSGVRAAAGVLMKNDLLRNWQSKSGELRTHILQDIPRGLLDSQVLVRNITGNVITSLVSLVGVANWPNVLPNLMELATGGAGTVESQEGAMSALAKICEDSARSLDRETDGVRPLNYMVPRFIELTESPSAKVRAHALQCLNEILTVKSQSILVNLDLFLSQLFKLASDDDPTVRTSVCVAFTSILDVAPERLLPHMDGVIDYCLHSIEDLNDDVALQSCEVILAIASAATQSVPEDIIKRKLHRVVPSLLQHMVYSEMEVFLMEGQDDKDNEDIADRDEDIRPQVARSKDAHTASRHLLQSNSFAVEMDGSDLEDGSAAGGSSGSTDDSDDEDEDELDANSSWTLRKCSAASLDILASKFPQEMLKVSFPVIKQRITSEEWPIREAAILALGAIAEGCWKECGPQLPELVPFLVDRLHDSQPRVRQITCWTLGRYSVWICGEAEVGGTCANYFSPTFQSIMDCALDTKKVVQQSACSALADFIENSEPDLLAQFVRPLLEHFQEYFHKYQRKNLIILYDTVQTFAEKMGDQISYNEDYVKLLLPPLTEKWGQLSDFDRDLWPLLECMSSVAAALGERFAPYAVPVYERALRILSQCIEQDRLAVGENVFDAPEKDFVVTSLDLADGLIQGLTTRFAEMAASSSDGGSSLMPLLLTCFDDTGDDVRQSAFALLGDLCIYCTDEFVLPNLHEVMVDIGVEISNQCASSSASCNNAIWALGEISIRISDEAMSVYLDNFLRLLLQILVDPSVDATVLENAAITIGRFGVHNSAKMGGYLAQTLPLWCNFVAGLDENEEKETAFQGMCSVVAENSAELDLGQASGRNAAKDFVDCIGQYVNPGNELMQTFHALLEGFKNGLGGPGWQRLLSELDPGVAQQVISTYAV